MNPLKIFSDKESGQIWAVVIVQDDPERYPLGPAVEFYDCRYEHTDYGQFVSSYYIETLLEEEPERHRGRPLQLYGGVESWVVYPDAMKRIREWLNAYEVVQ